MTNEIVQLAAPTADATMSFITIRTCQSFIPLHFVLWTVCVVLMPLVAGLAYVRNWKSARRGEESVWQPRIITLATVIVIAATLVEMLCNVAYILFNMGTSSSGDAQRNIACVSLSRVSLYLTIGIVSAAVCIGLRVMLPSATKQNNRQPTAAASPSVSPQKVDGQ